MRPSAGRRNGSWSWDSGSLPRVGGPVPIFFGPDEAGLLAEWERAWPARGEWMVIQEDLATAAAVLGLLGGVVTNDTGLMHLAAAVGTPVLALFGPTVREFGFFPVGEGHQVLEVPDLGCRPCSRHGGDRCPRGHFRCMLDVPLAEVEAALAALKPSRRRASGVLTP